jgi:hypothetical protein
VLATPTVTHGLAAEATLRVALPYAVGGEGQPLCALVVADAGRARGARPDPAARQARTCCSWRRTAWPSPSALPIDGIAHEDVLWRW